MCTLNGALSDKATAAATVTATAAAPLSDDKETGGVLG